MAVDYSLWIIVTMTSYKMGKNSATEVPSKGKRNIGYVFSAIMTARTLYLSKLALRSHNSNTDDGHSQEKEDSEATGEKSLWFLEVLFFKA